MSTLGRVNVGAAVEIVMMLVGAMLDVVKVHKDANPIALGLVKVLPRVKVKL